MPSRSFEAALLAALSDVVYETSLGKVYDITTSKGQQRTFRATIFSFKPGVPDSTLQYAIWDVISSDCGPVYHALCISFRGTHIPQDWKVNLEIQPRLAAMDVVNSVAVTGTEGKPDSEVNTVKSFLESAAIKTAEPEKDFGGLSLHKGFDSLLVEHEPEILQALSRYQADKGLQDARLLMTGHSLGGALASILFLRAMALHPEVLAQGAAAIVFGAPMAVCGDGPSAYQILNQVYGDFVKSNPNADVALQTWVNNNDVVPRLFGVQNSYQPIAGFETQEYRDLASSYHPVGTYQFIKGSSVSALPASDDSASPMGSTATEQAIAQKLGLPDALWRTADGGWRIGLQNHSINLYCDWLGSSWLDPTGQQVDDRPTSATNAGRKLMLWGVPALGATLVAAGLLRRFT